MQPDPDSIWPDWSASFSDSDESVNESTLRELARYANPDMLAMLGISTGTLAGPEPAAQHTDNFGIGIAENISAQLKDARRLSFTIEPFSAADNRAQIIRTASELLEGQGTCVDFAVAVAAGCVRVQVPVYLCVMVSPQMPANHAFLAIPPTSGQVSGWKDYKAETFLSISFDEFVQYVLKDLRCQIVDPTPPQPDAAVKTVGEQLEKLDGMVHLVLVQNAVGPEHRFHALPQRPRSLGITALLPELPVDLRGFPSRDDTMRRLSEATGTVVIIGDTGVGKSTLALTRAHAAASSRGWFLDGSDREALRASFAAAEAQCTGSRLDNVQKENTDSLAAFARRRLAATTRPWVVVVDNADEKIKDVADLLPRPGPRQLVIVTSVNRDWEEYASAAGWTVINVQPLERSDLSAAEQALSLPDRLLLPGLLRLGLAAAAAGLDSADGDIDVPRLLRGLFGDPGGFAGRLATDHVAASLVAAAVMPPEDIRQDWLAECVADPAPIPSAIARLVRLGVLETSRRVRDARTPDRRTFWLHRLVRRAVLETYVEVSAPPILGLVCRVLCAEPRLSPRVIRSRADLSTLAGLLKNAALSSEPLLPRAVLTVLESLEPLGGEAVTKAAALAGSTLRVFPGKTGTGRRRRAIPMLAMARPPIQKREPNAADLTAALALCDELSALLAGDQSVDGKLIRGRAEAMRALLLKKRASRLLGKGGDVAAIHLLLQEAIDVLIKSFTERSEALGWDPPRRLPTDFRSAGTVNRGLPAEDPDHHVDRSWYNLGGAYIDLAKVALTEPPGEERSSALRRQWSDALWAYAGSLSLRPDDTMYRAASLWGVALVLYMAALNNVVPLDLRGIARSEAIDDLWGKQDREVLLRVAEDCASRAHEIRADIAGPFDSDTRKTRDLMRKVSIAWLVARPRAEQADAVSDMITKFLHEDLGLPAKDNAAAGG
jgi:hypothetical protein